jgi:hypothetical protein
MGSPRPFHINFALEHIPILSIFFVGPGLLGIRQVRR